MVEDNAPAPFEVSEAMKLASAAENTDPGGFEPPSIAAARCSLDWPPCEDAIEAPSPPAPSDQRGHAVRPPQPASTDATFRRRHSAAPNSLPSTDHQFPPFIDKASARAAERTITHDVPYREAVDTTTWAALATPLASTLPNTNGNTAVNLDRRANSGHAFPTDGGTTPQNFEAAGGRPQASPPSPPGSDHVAATRGSTEAFWPRSPVSHAFRDFESHPVSFPKHQVTAAFTRDHHHHPQPGHIDVPHHRTRWDIKRGLRRPVYYPANDTAADAHAPSPAKEEHFAASLGLRAK